MSEPDNNNSNNNMSQRERRREKNTEHHLIPKFGWEWMLNGVIVRIVVVERTHKPPVAFLLLQNITIIYSLFCPYTLRARARVCVFVYYEIGKREEMKRRKKKIQSKYCFYHETQTHPCAHTHSEASSWAFHAPASLKTDFVVDWYLFVNWWK